MNNKRKVSTTGVLSYKGTKYYIKEKELKGKVVEVLRESEHQTLLVQFGKTKTIARQFEMISFSSIITKPDRTLEKDERIISIQGTFQYKGKQYFVENQHFHSRTVIVGEIGDQVQVKLWAAPTYKCFAEPVEEE